MLVFGENLATARFLATFCLLVAGIASYGIAVRHTTPLIAGMCVAVSLAGIVIAFPELNTELPVVALLMPAVWLLVARPGGWRTAFLVGLLIAGATLSRMNVGYVAVAVGCYYLWRWRGGQGMGREVAAYVLGGLLPLAALLLAYLIAAGTDGVGVFILSVFRVPLSYVSGQAGMVELLVGFVDRLDFTARTVFIVMGVAVWFSNGGKGLLSHDNKILMLVSAAMFLSIIRSGGGVLSHYLIQIMPFAAIFAAFGYDTLRRRAYSGVLPFVGRYPGVILFMALTAAVVLVFDVPGSLRDPSRGDLVFLVLAAFLAYFLIGLAARRRYLLQVPGLTKLFSGSGGGDKERRVYSAALIVLFAGLGVVILAMTLDTWVAQSIRQVRGQTLESPSLAVQRVVELIREDSGDDVLVYTPQKHIINWHLERRPPSKLVHPSDVRNEAITGPLERHGYLARNELERVLGDDNVGYIVTTTEWGLGFLRQPRIDIFNDAVARDFFPWREVAPYTIHKRRD